MYTCKPSIFQNLKYQRSICYKDIGIIKLEFVGKTQSLNPSINIEDELG